MTTNQADRYANADTFKRALLALPAGTTPVVEAVAEEEPRVPLKQQLSPQERLSTSSRWRQQRAAAPTRTPRQKGESPSPLPKRKPKKASLPPQPLGERVIRSQNQPKWGWFTSTPSRAHPNRFFFYKSLLYTLPILPISPSRPRIFAPRFDFGPTAARKSTRH